jgi:hypothetical protein
MMLSETSIVGGAMNGCKHLGDSLNRMSRKRLGRKCAWEGFHSRHFSDRMRAVKPTNRSRNFLAGGFMQ